MLKITLVLVVLVMCAAAVLVFGGAAEKTEDTADHAQSADYTGNEPGHGDIPPGTGTAVLTEESALEIYYQAREIWNWFELGTLPTTGAALQREEGSLLRAAGYDSLEALREYLEQYFSPELAEHLLTGYMTFQEYNGGLYVQPAGRGSSIYAGEETVTAFVYTGQTAAQQGVDCHIYATTEVLDEDLSTVLYQKRHDWYMAWNGQNYVFTSFGPYDDVDPQKYYNALSIVEHYKQDPTAVNWLPISEMAYLDWNALRATKAHWPENVDMCDKVNAGILEYVKAQDDAITAGQYSCILSATEGLDGAYSEQYQTIVYALYRRDPSLFAYTVLENLEGSYQAQILDYLRYEEQYTRPTPPDGTVMTREETTALLRQALTDAISASPSEMVFDQPGQTAQLLLINAHGISAATYTSSDPAVATVDDLGTVTAVTPGKAAITLHYEGAGGQKDFTCAVTCDWTVSEDGPTSSQMQDGEIIQGLSRGYGPTVWSTGSPENLELTLTGDWTLEGIEAALLSAVQRHVEGTSLEGDARAVTISYKFRFPEKMHDGVVMDVPFFIDYVDADVFPLPSGATHSPSSRTGELTAKVTLTGSGITAPVDEEFAAGQALYQKLAACVSIAEIQVDHDWEEYDLSMEIINRISSNLSEAGITDCFVDGLSFGSYHNPVWCEPGYTQVISGTVSFRREENRSASFPIEVTVHTVE